MSLHQPERGLLPLPHNLLFLNSSSFVPSCVVLIQCTLRNIFLDWLCKILDSNAYIIMCACTCMYYSYS